MKKATPALEKYAATCLRGLQFLLQSKFGAKATSESGECTIHVGPDAVVLTDDGCAIIARGPSKVATVLVRKRRIAK